VKFIRRTAAAHTLNHSKPATRTSVYLFYEKTSGTAHFHVEAGPDGELPVDHAAGLLAMHCMVRGQSPKAPSSLPAAKKKSLRAFSVALPTKKLLTN